MSTQNFWNTGLPLQLVSLVFLNFLGLLLLLLVGFVRRRWMLGVPFAPPRCRNCQHVKNHLSRRVVIFESLIHWEHTQAIAFQWSSALVWYQEPQFMVCSQHWLDNRSYKTRRYSPREMLHKCTCYHVMHFETHEIRLLKCETPPCEGLHDLQIGGNINTGLCNLRLGTHLRIFYCKNLFVSALTWNLLLSTGTLWQRNILQASLFCHLTELVN